MKQEEIRRRLIDGTVRVIAREGLDKATTKQIGNETNTNEAYIYRCFEDKEDMFAKTFESLDEKLVNKVMTHLPIMYMSEMEFETRCRLLFTAVWKSLVSNADDTLTFVQYYYSPYFKKYSVFQHKKRFEPVMMKFKDAFKDEADVWMLLNHILNVMLDFAVKVIQGEMPEDDNYTEHVFRVIYASVKQYFKETGE